MVNLLSLEHVFYVTSIIENYLVTKYWNKIMFQNKHNSVKQPYLGAYVQFPKKPGLHKNVAVLDFASLYPCVMMAYNISPETFIVSENQAKKNNLDLDKDIVDKLKEENS